MDWAMQFPGAVTVCDGDLTIVYMNEKAISNFAGNGGESLLGRNLADCHQPRSMKIIRKILDTGEPNVYTIEKGGKKKMIYQAPWRKNGEIAGLVEIAVEIPTELPHFARD